MGTITAFPSKVCCQCGAPAKATLELVDERGMQVDKHYCAEHFPTPMSDDSLRLLLDKRDAEIAQLRAVVNAPLAPDEMRLVDKHCDWIAFQHAWNAVMKRRREQAITS